MDNSGDLVHDALDHLARHELEQRPANRRPKNPDRWIRDRRRRYATELGEHAAHLAAEFPTAPPSLIAARLAGEPAPALANYRCPMEITA